MSQSLSIFAAAEQAADQLAVVGAERQWTFAEVAREVGKVLMDLRAQRPGLGPGALLAFSGTCTAEGLWTIYAALELGCGVVPLHARWTALERREFVDRLEAGPEWDLRDLGRNRQEPAPLEPQSSSPIDPEALLAMLSTSGSTGPPKGVALSRRAFMASAQADASNVGRCAGDRTLLSLPLAHVGGLSIVIRSLIARSAVVLPPPTGRFEPEAFVRWLHRFDVTLLSLVPTMLQRLLEADARPGPKLRAVLLGGAAASADLVNRARSVGWPVLRTYGLTEACSQVATERLSELHTGGEERSLRDGEVGPLLPGVEGRIVEGRLELRGPTLLSDYVPKVTGKPAISSEGWFATGDLARFDSERRLQILGRADDVIISGGENVSPAEVEMALESHPAVVTAAVFAVRDPEWGQAVRARVVAVDGAVIAGPELREFLRGRLAGFKIPRQIEVVPSLATTASGKIDRRMIGKALQEQALSKATELGSAD